MATPAITAAAPLRRPGPWRRQGRLLHARRYDRTTMELLRIAQDKAGHIGRSLAIVWSMAATVLFVGQER
jgi:hypothetical protein